MAPEPAKVVDPTDSVTVQAPSGNPLRATLPVATAQVGWVIKPTIGATGGTGTALITALADATEVQVPSLTVKVYVFAARPLKVAVVPEPANVVDPTDSVTVHAPSGKPLSATVPVAVAHVGWVIVPITGAVGVAGCGLTVALNDATEVQVPSLTVKVYVFAARPLKVAVAPEPANVVDPTDSVTVHAPSGKPLSATLPVAVAHVGWVMVPITGAVGDGLTVTTTGLMSKQPVAITVPLI